MLAKILQEPFNYVWENRDIYELIEFTSYEKFDSFREKMYYKRLNK